MKLYLDDTRIPVDKDWTLVTNYDEFVDTITKHGLHNFTTISFDHDLGDSAMAEYWNNVHPNFELNYENITEKTGMDCVKWLINHFMETNELQCDEQFQFPNTYVHSANPIGSANIMGYVNNFLKNMKQPQTCVRVRIEHKNRERENK